jgi:arylsulfatase A-like enzyme
MKKFFSRVQYKCPWALAIAIFFLAASPTHTAAPQRKPNILFLLTDQWRADALGYTGDPNVKTPNIDRLATQGVNFTHAVAGCPVCCPTRASLMTGQRPLTHGVFMNDVPLPDEAVTVAEVLAASGYLTGYIGKWHLDGRGRLSYTPPRRRQGFKYWKAVECTHNYNESYYYADSPEKRKWKGYDAISQTRDAQAYIREHAHGDKPFFLFLSWGPPHAPYDTAPAKYRALYKPAKIKVRPNIEPSYLQKARENLAGYYAHATALDDCVANLRMTLAETGIAENTILVFTSEHGDLLGSHGFYKKQQPYEESIRVPLLIHYPKGLGMEARTLDAPINSEDIMPTLLGLCGVEIPTSVEGLDYSGYLRGEENPSDGTALITCPQPFGQWSRKRGGREFRGIRTSRYTFTRDLKGPWLLFDNEKDPFQLDNLANRSEHAKLQAKLDAILQRKLEETQDEFLPGKAYIEKWGYLIDATGTVPIRK